MGVMKALANARLLPRIISGASTGSIMASIICTINEEERLKLLNSPWSIPMVSNYKYACMIKKIFIFFK
jgi:predicted acylesterase/phospholipase RssA